jgi:phospholipase C
MATLSDIKHVVVLMLENRSFDNVFGHLYTDGRDFKGLASAQNPGNPGPDGTPIPPWTDPGSAVAATLPTPDPGELFVDITQQLFGNGPANGVPPMNGFTANYVRHGGNARDIMHCFSPEELPALTQLAKSYAVSDMWFASAPCQTWPNRFFAHAGTANGYENNDNAGFPFPMQTIFNELAPTYEWRIYFHDFSQAALLQRLWPYFGYFRPFCEFLADVNSTDMPSYSFLEPQYFPGLEMPSDLHPPHNVAYGDALVAQVYNAVRNSPNWASTMLIITCDEHGGCYDHVPPPAAVPPEKPRPGQVFNFDRYGVRVPAVIISPYTKPETILRSTGPQPFDHTSIIRTVRACFGLQTPLSAREASAPDLSAALNDSLNLDRAPAQLDVAAPQTTSAELQAAQNAVPNGLQILFHDIAARLAPLTQPGVSVEQHLQTVVQPNPLGPPMSGDAVQAGTYAAQIMQSLSDAFSSGQAPKVSPAPLDSTSPDDVYFGGS